MASQQPRQGVYRSIIGVIQRQQPNWPNDTAATDRSRLACTVALSVLGTIRFQSLSELFDDLSAEYDCTDLRT